MKKTVFIFAAFLWACSAACADDLPSPLSVRVPTPDQYWRSMVANQASQIAQLLGQIQQQNSMIAELKVRLRKIKDKDATESAPSKRPDSSSLDKVSPSH